MIFSSDQRGYKENNTNWKRNLPSLLRISINFWIVINKKW